MIHCVKSQLKEYCMQAFSVRDALKTSGLEKDALM